MEVSDAESLASKIVTCLRPTPRNYEITLKTLDEREFFAFWLGSLKVIPTLKIFNLHHPNLDTTFFSGVLIRGKLLC